MDAVAEHPRARSRPGPTRLQSEPLYSRLVNQEIAGLTTEEPARKTKRAVLDPLEPANPVTLFSGAKQPPQRLRYDAMVPKNMKDTFHNWEAEILGSGVHIHSKIIVLDPFGANPVVMTGSHNLGFKASHANDDNLMIVQGNAPLAAAYAANIIAIYQSYRWNAYVEAHRQDPHVWHGLVDNDTWQASHLAADSDNLKEIMFWLGGHPGGAPPPPPPPGPAPDSAPARAVTAGPAPDGAPAGAVTARPAQASARPRRARGGKGTRKTAKKKAVTKKKTKKRPPVSKRAPARKKKRRARSR